MGKLGTNFLYHSVKHREFFSDFEKKYSKTFYDNSFKGKNTILCVTDIYIMYCSLHINVYYTHPQNLV